LIRPLCHQIPRMYSQPSVYGSPMSSADGPG